jgi:hypothetical protein
VQSKSLASEVGRFYCKEVFKRGDTVTLSKLMTTYMLARFRTEIASFFRLLRPSDCLQYSKKSKSTTDSLIGSQPIVIGAPGSMERMKFK